MLSFIVEVPIACFRQSQAREYAETYPLPPPSTVYGMLLSLVGEMDRHRHCGARVALGLLSQPEKSTVVRTFRRFKSKDLADPRNARPDYQELLTGLSLCVWVASETEKRSPTLNDRLADALANPAAVDRFGGLCLGESRDLVDAISLLDRPLGQGVRWLMQDPDGWLSLPYWVDHVGSQETRWLRYSLQVEAGSAEPPAAAWTEIHAT